jgi:DNA-binding CsgD family transcriptional regulator
MIAPMALLERDAQVAAIAGAVAAAEDGYGSVIVVSGPAGIGKTAVLAAARDFDQVRALAARAGALERELALGVVRQLLEPVLVEADRTTRARLLRDTGPAAAVLEGRATGDGDPSAVLHGLHHLVANLAAERPLLVEIDDVQWADAASLRLLAFVARRVATSRVVLLLARRAGERAADEAALDAIASEANVQELALAPLSLAAGTGLVRRLAGDSADERFCQACHRASAGNPFVLRELVNALAVAGVAPNADGAAEVAAWGPPTVARWVLARLARMLPSANALAGAVAVLGQDADLGRAARLAGLSLGEGEAALDALIEADVLALGRPLDFVHPVVRAAVHDAMPPGRRSRAHREAARLLREQGAPPGAVGTHLLSAEPASEPWVAEALLEAARTALAQGAPEVAARHVERALAEPPARQLQGSLFRTLGSAERRLGLPTADRRFLEALERTGDARERAETVLDMVITGAPRADAMQMIHSALRDVEGVDAELGLMLRARLVLLAVEFSSEAVEPERRAAEQALAAHGEDTLGTRLLAGVLAGEAAMRARNRRSVLVLARRAVASDGSYASDLEAGYPHIHAMIALWLADEPALAEQRFRQAAERAERRGSLVGAGIALLGCAHVRCRSGALLAAEDTARRALELATRTGEEWLVGESVGALVLALVERGEVDAAEAVLRAHKLTEALGASPQYGELALARSLLRLSTGRPADAYRDALAARSFTDERGIRNPVLAPWRSRAALALIALGRPADARMLAHEELQIADTAQTPSAIGVARRVLALASGEADITPLLRNAVTVLESAPAPLEHARALIDLGGALRRSGRRRAAREPLARALEISHRNGAAPLAVAARAELLASGARPRREVRSGLDALTPSERRVAELAADGLTNAEIAARLFITAKTAEHHLAATYRKLDISSRKQLPALLEPAETETTAQRTHSRSGRSS